MVHCIETSPRHANTPTIKREQCSEGKRKHQQDASGGTLTQFTNLDRRDATRSAFLDLGDQAVALRPAAPNIQATADTGDLQDCEDAPALTSLTALARSLATLPENCESHPAPMAVRL